MQELAPTPPRVGLVLQYLQNRPTPFWGKFEKKKKKNHNNKGLLIVVIVLICQRPLFLFLNTSTWFLYIVSEMSGPVV